MPQLGQPRKTAGPVIWNLAPALSPPVVSDIVVEPPIRAVLRELNKPTDLRIEKMPLKEFVEYLTKRYKIQFRLDRGALRQLGVSDIQPFSVTAVGRPLNLALERNLRPLGLRTRVVDGIVFITANAPVERAMAPPRAVPAPIAAVLQEKTDIEVQIMPLDKFAQFLTAKYKIRFLLDRNGLQQVDVHPSTPVSARLEGVTLDRALRHILGRFRLTYRVVGARIVITSNGRQPEQPRVIAGRRGLPMQPVLQPGFVAPRFAGARRPQLAVTLKPLIEAELLFMKKVCDPSKEQLGHNPQRGRDLPRQHEPGNRLDRHRLCA